MVGGDLLVTVQSLLELSEGGCLNLVCVLQLLNPFCFVGFQTRDFVFNLNTFFIFLVNLPNQVQALLLTLQIFFL